MAVREMFENQEPYFDWLTPAVNALIGLFQMAVTFLASFALQQFGFPMFNFIAPWLPLIAFVAFLNGVVCSRRLPQNVWVLAFQMNIPALLLGIYAPFFWLGACLSIVAIAAGVRCGRILFRQPRHTDLTKNGGQSGSEV